MPCIQCPLVVIVVVVVVVAILVVVVSSDNAGFCIPEVIIGSCCAVMS